MGGETRQKVTVTESAWYNGPVKHTTCLETCATHGSYATWKLWWKFLNFLVKVHFFSQTSENFSKVTENFSKECTFLVKHEKFFLQKNASENNFS